MTPSSGDDSLYILVLDDEAVAPLVPPSEVEEDQILDTYPGAV